MDNRDEPIPVAKLKAAKSSAEDLAHSLIPETLDKCTAPEPDVEDGLTQDEKFLAISRLEVSGRTRSSKEAQTREIYRFEGENAAASGEEEGATGASSNGPKPKSPVLTLRYGWVCQCGFYPEDLSKKNQDNLLVAPDLGPKYPDLSLFGVFDGHGRYGTECSTYAVDKFSKCMLHHKQLRSAPETAFEDSLIKVNKEMHKQKRKRKGPTFFDDTLAGTTCISALFVEDDVIVANVGDSRAILASDMGGGRIMAQPLSADQTPYRADERDRCRQAGAVVMTMDQLEGYKPYDPSVEEWGDEEDDGGDPPRLWLPNKGCPGVAFTRSLGDEMAESIGCCPNPEVLRRKLTPHDRFIVIASDGVFEFLSSQTVVDMVAKFDDPYEAARALVTESYKLWLHYEVRTDDITAIVIFTEHHEAAKVGLNNLTPGRSPEMGMTLSATGSFRSYDALLAMEKQNRPVRREMSRTKRALIEASTVFEEEEEDDDDAESERPPKSAEEIEEIKMAISTNFLFQHLNPMQLDEVLAAFESKPVKAGETIISQGEHGDNFYVVGSGEYDCFLKQEGSEEQRKVHTYVSRAGSVGNPSFGELALMYSKPRAASVVAKTDGQLWALGRKTFRRVLIKRPNKELIRVLRTVKILETLGKGQLQRLADQVSEVSYNDGETIIKQGDMGDTMYIVKEGGVRCLISEETDPAKIDPSKGKEVMRLEAGSYFGERSLLNAEPRAASVLSVGKTICFYISKNSFEQVLGPLGDIIARHARKRELESLAAADMPIRCAAAGVPFDVPLEGVTPKAVIHTSDTIRYRVVNVRGAESPCTLKSFDRKAVMAAKTENMPLRDRALLPIAAVEELPSLIADSSRRSHDGASQGISRGLSNLGRSGAGGSASVNVYEPIFPILKTFVGHDGLHVALAGVACGTLHDFMAEPLEEDVVRFVAANIVVILDRLHERNILARSINPQTLMLNSQGYVSLADLGCGKYMEDTSIRTFTMCGDPGYVAPEQVLNAGHGLEVDFWALGILTYEMLTSKLPFNETDLFSQITNFDPNSLDLPKELSKEARDFLHDLLQPSPDRRLSNLEDTRQHPFLAKVDFDAICTGTFPSPLHEAAQNALQEILTTPTPREEAIDSGTLEKIPISAWFKNF
ncbi:Protein phosphatase 2C and cyclic nucleotide-binding/kinase domain-containing protein [Hondaea fermentalgiana]|uniref:cGMP-dependent protein kinase n=1 Tax=Hondaea fermentalgiana TaxID=2315210 RepID=A0A2R5GIV0_9STRA|nr:Protein phosphatase 2C and cyclic nucleotide-binding/kinase domain-containing protein [Hondaea fermentalgiana]|eukprot:GBG30816.1 Protein phosphatase 2C and cyclic nucleotide-binding/kinase domain-containing protein [Hondaea fermentalgiana]